MSWQNVQFTTGGGTSAALSASEKKKGRGKRNQISHNWKKEKKVETLGERSYLITKNGEEEKKPGRPRFSEDNERGLAVVAAVVGAHKRKQTGVTDHGRLRQNEKQICLTRRAMSYQGDCLICRTGTGRGWKLRRGFEYQTSHHEKKPKISLAPSP